MSSYLEFAILGLGSAAAFTLLAQGLVLVYRATGVINFAQGAYAMVGAYSFYELHTKSGIPVVLAGALTLLIGAGLGILSYVLVMRPLRRAAPLARVMASLGILTILQSAATLRYKDAIINVDTIFPSGPVHVFSATVPQDRFWLLGIVIAVTAALSILSHRTRWGLATYAVAENEQAVAALGWSPDLIATVNWGAGAALAAAAGILISPLVGLQVGVLILLLIPTLAVALLGQFESFWLALAGALLIGILQSELIGNVSSQPWMPDVVPFAVILVVMVIRGRALPLRHQIAERPPRVGSGRIIWPAAVAAVVLAVVANLLLPDDWVSHLIVTEAFALLILSIVVLTGYTGQLSLAQFAVAGIAALVAGRLVATQGWGFLPAGLVGVAAATGAGLLFAIPALRQRGVNLAVVTAGMGAAIYAAFFTNSSFTGGVQGTQVGSQKLFGLDLDTLFHPSRYSLFVLAILIVFSFAICALRRSPAGRRLIAVRLNERAAAALGVNIAAAKMFAFGASAVIAGVAGVLLAFRNPNILYGGFDSMGSVTLVTLAVVGGVGFVTGAGLGALLAVGGIGTVISQKIVGDSADNWLALVGGVFVIVILLQDPDGMASQYSRGLAKFRERWRSRDGHPADVAPSDGAGAKFSAGRLPERLAVEGVHVRFGGVVALDGVSIEVNPGEIVGLIGPNGAGKTTFVDAVTGFVRPQRGKIELAGAEIGGWPAYRRARAGLVRSFQSLELFDELTVHENLQTSADPQDARSYVSGLVPRRDRPLPDRVLAAVRALGLHDELGRRADELSYGRRRLLAIARSIASDPTVLLLDEPAAGLDENEGGELGRMLRAVVETTGLGILLIEHEMPLVMSLCDRLVVLDFGRVIATGTPAEVQANPLVIDAYLGQADGAADAGAPARREPATHGAA